MPRQLSDDYDLDDLTRQQNNRRDAQKRWRVYTITARGIQALGWNRATDQTMSWLPSARAMEFVSEKEARDYLRDYTRWWQRLGLIWAWRS